MSKTAALVIARLSSKRIPNKNILDINGIPMIKRLVDRLRKSSMLDDVIVCTSEDESDQKLCELCKKQGISFGVGPLDNVMERIRKVALQHNVTNIVEVLGDNPFIEHGIVDKAIQYFLDDKEIDYCANYSNDYQQIIDIPKFPIGIRAQVYSTKNAHRYNEEGLVKLEHPSSYLYSNPDKFKTFLFGATDEWEKVSHETYNISINYPNNFKFAEYMFSKFGPDVSILEVIEELNSNEALRELIAQKI